MGTHRPHGSALHSVVCLIPEPWSGPRGGRRGASRCGGDGSSRRPPRTYRSRRESFPAGLRELGSYREGLVPDVVELEHDRVRLAAVDAGMRREVIDQPAGSLQRHELLPGLRLVDVPLPVRRVVLFAVRRATRPTHGVALTPTPAPGELVRRFLLAAAATLKRLGRCHGEPMFAGAADGEPTVEVAGAGGHCSVAGDLDGLPSTRAYPVRPAAASASSWLRYTFAHTIRPSRSLNTKPAGSSVTSAWRCAWMRPSATT